MSDIPVCVRITGILVKIIKKAGILDGVKCFASELFADSIGVVMERLRGVSISQRFELYPKHRQCVVLRTK
jgi:hypothetical protein